MNYDESRTTDPCKRRKSAPWLFLVVVIIMMLPPAYMGAYYAMLDGHTKPTFGGTARPVYRFSPSIVETIFSPAHCLDRRLRRQRWEAPDLPPVYL